LAILTQNAGKVVTREDLQKKLWPADTFVDFDQGLNKATWPFNSSGLSASRNLTARRTGLQGGL
jgi:hypothetical protein